MYISFMPNIGSKIAGKSLSKFASVYIGNH